MKNVGVTLITVVGLVFSGKIGGTLLTETVFAIPGTGSALIQAAINKDYAVVQGIILMLALLVFLVNLAVDLLYAALDPRVE
jgi:peptide/nickel transport system permease protein